MAREKEAPVTVELKCAELNPGCGTVIRGEDEEEVLEKVAEHVREEHAVNGLNDEQVRDVRSRIVPAEGGSGGIER